MFITIKNRKTFQITTDMLFSGVFPKYLFEENANDTITYNTDKVHESTIEQTNFALMHSKIKEFNEKYKNLIATKDKSKLYYSFKIPKASGGLRQINAPNTELMEALNELKKILEQNFYFTYHTCAFAYIRGRSTLDAVKRHKKNESKWFLKTDLHSFFNSSSIEFVLEMLYKTYPLSVYATDPTRKKDFEKAISLCFLDGGLPQGTPTSPMLTNQMMIPIDYEMSKYCHEHTPYLVYTRYADDIFFSSRCSFTWSEVLKALTDKLKYYRAPFTVNKEKTRYGSNAGRNWMLGVMYNQKCDITIGHVKKNNLKVCVFQFIKNFQDGKRWSLEDAQHLQGLISYYSMVEPAFVNDLIDTYNKKLNADFRDMMKKTLR